MKLNRHKREAVIERITDKVLARLAEVGLPEFATLHDLTMLEHIQDDVAYVSGDRLVLEVVDHSPSGALRQLETTIRQLKLGAEQLGLDLVPDLHPTTARTSAIDALERDAQYRAVATFRDGAVPVQGRGAPQSGQERARRRGQNRRRSARPEAAAIQRRASENQIGG